MIVVNEIFFSIQGESSWAGYPTTFVRTSGCHLRCHYCDTTYAYHNGNKMSVNDIFEAVKKQPTKYVCITGGEPLLHKEIYQLMTKLCNSNYNVSLETSGDKCCKQVDPRVKKIIDIKTPDSGEPHSFFLENLAYLDKNTEFKFVICSPEDFLWAEQYATEKNIFAKSNVLYSPSYNEIKPRWLAQQILKKGSKARLQLQLHKFLWPADARGV